MIINPTPALIDGIFWITLIAVTVSSASAVLKAGFKQFDLFGAIIIAIATGLGGGTLRDLLLDKQVFWIQDQIYFLASIFSAIAIFLTARFFVISPRFFLIPDAAGLATFGIAGTLVSLMNDMPWLVASFMGVMTGAIGGIFRDILCNEQPVVFQGQLYATVCWGGSLLFIGLIYLDLNITLAAAIAGLSIFITRLLAIHFNLSLPRFKFRDH